MDFRDIACLLSASEDTIDPFIGPFDGYLLALSCIQPKAAWGNARPTGIDAPGLVIWCIEIETMNQAAIKKAIALEGCSNTRRRLLRRLSSIALGLPFSRVLALASASQAGAQHQAQQRDTHQAPPPSASPISAADDQFLDQLEHANFLFFWEQANPQTGLIKDRCNVRVNDTSLSASIASTGFGLTAICIGEKRGFISYPMARLRVVQTLSFLWHKLPTHRGFFFHFANMNTGERIWDSEVSSVDTAILLCGVLTCRQYFQDKRYRRPRARYLRSCAMELAF